MLRFALRGASIPRQVINSQKRFSGGGLKHNIPIEENQGLREITYWTWDFEFSSLTRLVMYLFLPGYFLMESVKADFETRDKQMGRTRIYGIIPEKNMERRD